MPTLEEIINESWRRRPVEAQSFTEAALGIIRDHCPNVPGNDLGMLEVMVYDFGMVAMNLVDIRVV